jgi:hypothetical protein
MLTKKVMCLQIMKAFGLEGHVGHICKREYVKYMELILKNEFWVLRQLVYAIRFLSIL